MSEFRTHLYVKRWKRLPRVARLNLRIVRWKNPPLQDMPMMYRPMISNAYQAAEVWMHENLA